MNNLALIATLDLTQPVALILVATLHFVEDAQQVYPAVATLVDALAPGSFLAATHGTEDLLDATTKAKATAENRQEPGDTIEPDRPMYDRDSPTR